MALPARTAPASTGGPASIGRFVVVRRLGSGGQGVVWLASDPDLGREVAIKTLNRGGGDPQRLVDEARNVGRLQHASIVPLYEIGTHAGHPYLVYPYVQGRTLKAILAGGEPVPVRQALQWLSSLLDAIGYAHAAGIVHRDLAPANIMIDEAGTPRILDFGVAGVAGMTAANDIVGTANYMAPESLTGAGVGPRGDLFSLAVVLHEMLTGKPLFEAANPMAVMYKVVHENALPPSRLKDGIDRALDAVVLKGLVKNPSDRYASAQEMRAAIDTWLTPEAPAAGEPAPGSSGAADFLLRRMRRNPDFPAVSQHVAEISNKARSGSASHSSELANVILKDYALSSKLLRLVNSAIYGQYGGSITTVSRAVAILGFEQVRLAALSIALFEHLKSGPQADALKSAVCGSFLSGMVARTLAGRHRGVNVEESFIAAMFYRLGKLLTIHYFADEFTEIQALVANKGEKEDQAVRTVLGASYAELGVAVGREWKLPDCVLAGMRVPRSGAVSTGGDAQGLMAALANEIADVAGDASAGDPRKALGPILERYRGHFELDSDAAMAAVEAATLELKDYARILSVDVDSSGFYHAVVARCRRGTDAGTGGGETAVAAPEPGGAVPVDDREQESRRPDGRIVLVNALAELAGTLLGDYTLNDVFVMVLEALYRGLGFTRVVFCARDPKSGAFIARFGFGAAVDEVQPRFRFTPAEGTDAFSVAVRERRDLAILDTQAADGRHEVPAWCRSLTAPRSLVLFPVVANRVTIGLIYADRTDEVARFGAEDLRLTKALLNQVTLAVQSRGRR